MATAMERKFTGLRKRLDQLGYRQPLGVESLPLVERIFSDLLHTTESLRNAKLQLAKNKEQKGKSCNIYHLYICLLYRFVGTTCSTLSTRQWLTNSRKHWSSSTNHEA